MGVDFRGVNNVIHYGPPRDIESYMQAYGRAGRDGSRAHSLILYNGRQLQHLTDKMKQYVTDVTSCRRVKLLMLFDGQKSQPLPILHECCTTCAMSCDCNDQCDGQMSAFETHAEQETDVKERNVSLDQRNLLQEKLHDMAMHINHEGLYGPISVYHTTQSDNIDDLIKAVMEKSSVLFTLDDIFCNVQVSNVQEALAIMTILRDVFDDVQYDADEESMDDDDSAEMEASFSELEL